MAVDVNHVKSRAQGSHHTAAGHVLLVALALMMWTAHPLPAQGLPNIVLILSDTSVDLQNPVANLKYRNVVREDGWN